MNRFLKGTLIVSFAVSVLAGCSSNQISSAEAEALAMSHAGVTKEQIVVMKNETDRENGKTVYDIEFQTDDFCEYDYKIDAKSGILISYHANTENVALKENNKAEVPASDSIISEDDAKAKVLERIAGATEENIKKFHLEKEDGRMVYEGTVIFEQKEYEFEVDATSGAIVGWDEESVFD